MLRLNEILTKRGFLRLSNKDVWYRYDANIQRKRNANGTEIIITTVLGTETFDSENPYLKELLLSNQFIKSNHTLDKFDYASIERYARICANAYARTISGAKNMQTKSRFRDLLLGDSSSYYATEVKAYKIKPILNKIRESYMAKFPR